MSTRKVAIDLDWQGWFVAVSLAFSFLIMAFDMAGPDLVFTILLAIYVTAGILPVTAPSGCNANNPANPCQNATAGYNNTGLLTVVFLYLVAEGINQAGGLEKIMVSILGRSRSPYLGLIRMMLPCMALSAFLNNTPIVALLIPVILSWCRRTGIPIKKMLMPLSIAAVLGGTITLIGTSTNLVVSGAQAADPKNKGTDAVNFRIFDIAPYGIPYVIWGFIFVIFMERWLLPGNSSRFASDLLLALRVGSTSPLSGQTLEGSGLRSAYGLTIAGLVRKGVWINLKDLFADFVLNDGDVFYVIAEFDTAEFYAEELGLDLYSSDSNNGIGSGKLFEVSDTGRRYKKLVQISVQPTSRLVGLDLLSANLGQLHGITVFGYQRRKDRKDGPFSDFVIAAYDVLVIDAGTASDITGEAFLLDFKDIHEIKAGLAKEYILEAVVTGGDVPGHTVSGAGLRGIPGITVFAVDPKGDFNSRQSPISYTTLISKGDTLWIAADLAGVTFLTRFPGLEFPQQSQVTKTGWWYHWYQSRSHTWIGRLGAPSRWLLQYFVDSDLLEQHLFTAILSPSSVFVGSSVLDLKLRKKLNAAVFAISREGVRKPLLVTNTVLQAGDGLLISAPLTFLKANENNPDFASLALVPKSTPPKKARGTLSLLLGLCLVLSQVIPGIMSSNWILSYPKRNIAVVSGGDWINLWSCAVLTSAVMLITGCFTGDQARQSILWDVYLAIGGAFGVSAAMERTNFANEFAQIFIYLAKAIGGRGAGLTSIYVATALLSEILTNNASGAIMYPIAAIAGRALNIEPRATSIAIMLGASAGFINPFSYQTNMMVYAAGNYKFIEFVKFGVPFQTYLLVVAGFILSFYDEWKQVWIVSFIALAVVCIPPLLWAVLPRRFTRPIDLAIEEKAGKLRAYFRRSQPVGQSVRSESDGLSLKANQASY